MVDLYDATNKKQIVIEQQGVEPTKEPETENKTEKVTIEQETPVTVPVKKPEFKQTVRDFIPKKSGFSLSSLIVRPSSSVRFATQDPQEEVLMILRAHWMTNLPWLFVSACLVLAPKLLLFFPLLDAFPGRFQTAFIVVWYLVAIMYTFEKFLGWFFNLSIITDERIIDVNFYGLTNRKVADAELEKIQDVTFANHGVFGTIFNYGNVLVQTAAEVTQFVFDDVPRPGKVAEILQKLRLEEKQEALEGRIR